MNYVQTSVINSCQQQSKIESFKASKQWWKKQSIVCLRIISLHIRSMWETICDAWACWSGWNFGPNSSRIPRILKYSFRIPPSPENENCQSPNLRVSEYPPQNENCQRVQIWEFQNTPTKWKLSESPNPRVSEYPPPNMKIVRESKSESFRIPPHHPPPKNENCQRVQIREFQNTPPHPTPNWKNFRFQTSE